MGVEFPETVDKYVMIIQAYVIILLCELCTGVMTNLSDVIQKHNRNEESMTCQTTSPAKNKV